MTPPPINIDGTDITGATIDGTDVSEVTAGGETVFSALPDSVVDTFETALYEDQNRSLSDVYDGDLVDYTRQTGTVFEGSYALQSDSGAITETDDLNHPQSGDKWHTYLKPNAGGELGFSWFTSADGSGNIDTGYFAALNTSGTWRLKVGSYSSGSPSSAFASGSITQNTSGWYEFVVNHDESVDEFTVELYNPSGSLEEAYTLSDASYTSGGIGFDNAITVGDTATGYWDSYELL